MRLYVAVTCLALLACGTSDRDLPILHIDRVAFQDQLNYKSGGSVNIEDPTYYALSRPRTVLQDSSLHRVSSLVVRDSLIVMTDRMASPHITIVSRRSGAVLERLGLHGYGENEFLDPVITGLEERERDIVKLLDLRAKRLSILHLSRTGSATLKDSMAFETKFPVLGVFHSGGQLLLSGLFADFALLRMNTHATTATRIHVAPPFDTTSSPSDATLARLNKATVVVAADGRLAVIAYQHAGRVDFLQPEQQTYSSVVLRDSLTVKFTELGGRLMWQEDSEFAYVDLALTNRHVYALYCGCKYTSGNLPREVHVYSKDGRFIRAYRLDTPVLQFTVDDVDGALIGVATSPPRVVEWALPPIDQRHAETGSTSRGR